VEADLKDPAELSTNDGYTREPGDSGAAYLRSLKQYQAERPLEAAPTPTPDAAGTGAERRRSTRHKCQGSVRFRTDDDVVHTYGTLTDVSMHGCYVEMMATSPVGTMVNMMIEVNGVRADVRGEVKVSYPFLGMGIEFKNVDVENRKGLREISASLLPRVNAVSAPAQPIVAAEPLLIPIITDPAAALGAIANHFQAETTLSRHEFLHLIQKSQSR